MNEILALRLIKVYDTRQREKKECVCCERRRLCTLHEFQAEGHAPEFVWICNECMCAVPPWPWRKA